MSTPHDPTGSFSLLDAILAAYVQAVEAGQSPVRADVVARHPDLAEPLLAFFADLDRIDRVAAPFRLDAAPNPPATVRYFGDYELIEEVARGGMGIVYRARQVSLNRVVALKMVLAGGHASPRAVQRFRLEAEAAANLDHPHIVPIHEVGDHEGIPYYSMKFVDGVPLGQAPRGTFRDEAAALATVARAVHHAHHHGVLHRDLKPANVLVDPKLGWLVTDFGLAKRLTDVDAGLTETGDILGTPRYMAPEQAAGRRDLTVTADVYSLGAILFERLTGRPPFLADNVVTLLHQVRESDPPRPSTLVPGLGRDLETIVLKCLDKDPSRRYATAEALAMDLESWVEGRPIAARPIGKVGRGWRWCKRNPVVAGLMATVAASMVGGTAVSVAFAVKADAQALDAGMAATRARILLAKSIPEPTSEGVWALKGGKFDFSVPMEHSASDECVLSYFKAFELAPTHRQANDLRWTILANLAAASQSRRRPLLLNRGEDDQPATAFSTSPDGRRWAEASPDGTVRIWDLPDGRLSKTLQRHAGGISRIVFSADGSHLATISRNDMNWYPATERHLGGWRIGRGVWDFEHWDRTDFKDGDRAVRIWDLATGELTAVLMHDSSPTSAEFSQDNERIFTSTDSTSQGIKSFLWKLPQHKPKNAEINAILLFADFGSIVQSPDGKNFAVQSGKSTYRVFEQMFGKCMFSVKGDSIVWNSTADEIATVGWVNEGFEDGSVHCLRIFDASFGKPLAPDLVVKHASMGAPRASYSPDCRFVIYQDQYPDLFRIFSRSSGRNLLTVNDRQVANVSPDSSFVYLDDGQVLDTRTWERLNPPEGRMFHPALRGQAKIGRLFIKNNEMWDLTTELTIGPRSLWFEEMGSGSDRFQNGTEIPEGLVWSDAGTLKFIPCEPFATDTRTVKLWAEVLTRKRWIGEHDAQPLTEADWETRRQELIRKLPPSPSPLLTNLATDRAYWRREEAKNTTGRDEEFLLALDRLLGLEKKWYYYHARGLSHAKLKHWDEAARDFLTAGRGAGDWYWDRPPVILDYPIINNLRLDAHPERTLRETLHHGPEVTEVAMHYLEFLRRDPDWLRQVAEAKALILDHGFPADPFAR